MKMRILSSLVLSSIAASTMLGCAVEPAAEAEEPAGSVATPGEDGPLGVTFQALGGWAGGSRATTSSLNSLQLAPTDSWGCFLSGVAGKLSKGTVGGERSLVRVGFGAYNYGLAAHGGARMIYGQKFWDGNMVGASAVCVPHVTVLGDFEYYWESGPTVNPPVWLTGLGGIMNRQCFLSALEGGDGLWTDSDTYARVVRITTPDASHPRTGWYVESNMREYNSWAAGSGGHARVHADCFDFPQREGYWWGEFSGDSAHNLTVTNDLTPGSTGVKACGLTMVKGAFMDSNASGGVRINAPSTINGMWTMSVAPGKRGRAECVQ